ncbi:uncharacterized protein [Euwallacea similis]|uniref:uncharacterized protein n=1 Tax=Euwallacea similis TaxID=1736056 RepID=UPI00344E8262
MIEKKGRSFAPTTVYIHDQKLPYPYYFPPSHAPPHCEIIATDSHGHMWMPPYFLPLVVLGSMLLSAVITLGLLMLLDRVQTTPVVRAREMRAHSRLESTQEMFAKAIEVYNQLNGS